MSIEIMETTATNTTSPVPSVETTTTVSFAKELAELESLGFTRRTQNLCLLRKTNGNLEIVKKLLEAREEFRQAVRTGKKEGKFCKKDYKLKKRELKELDDEEFKEELKDELKQGKKDWKEERRNEKKQKKELKQLEKEEKKKERKEKKYEKYQRKGHNKPETEQTIRLESLPTEITNVWLDGNNMLFVLGSLRTRVLNKNRNEAEQLFELMAKSWIEKTPQVQQCTLIFDNTKTNKTELEGRLKVCSARPEYPTSDHALIEWSANAMNEEKKTIAVFTSDRALTEQLVKNGVNVFKPKSWFNIVAKCFGETDQIPDLDVWSERWLSLSLQNINVNNNNNN